MDDHWMIYGNSTVIDLNPKSLYDLFFSMYFYQHSPVNTLYYRIIYLIAGMDPFAFHLASLIVHLINIYLVYLFVKSILPKTVANDRTNRTEHIALIVSLLFAMHPTNVESIVWLSASKVILYSTFFLIGMLIYISYIKNQKISLLLLVCLFFLLSILSKEQAVIFPINMILLDMLYKRRPIFKLFLEKAPFFFISVLYGLLTLHNSGMPASSQHTFFKQFSIASFNLVSYVINLVSPLWLRNLYPIPKYIDIQLPIGYYICAISVVLILLCAISHYILQKWKIDIISFGLAFFLINIILATHLIPMNRPMIMADRYLYLPSIGLFLIIVSLLYNKISEISKVTIKRFSISIFIIYCLLCACITFKNINNYKKNEKDITESE